MAPACSVSVTLDLVLFERECIAHRARRCVFVRVRNRTFPRGYAHAPMTLMVFDFSCDHQHRTAFFHSLNDCLFRLLPVLGHAMRESTRGRSVLVYCPTHMLSTLISSLEPSLAIASRFPAAHINVTRVCGLDCGWNSWEARRALRVRTWNYLPPPLRDLRRAPSGRPSCILIQRQRFPRMFTSRTLKVLRRSISNIGFNVSVFRHAPLRDAWTLFASARCIVGYHGAALIQGAFCYDCFMIELSTYTVYINATTATNRKQRIPFRSNAPALHWWNPSLTVQVHRLPLEQLIASNLPPITPMSRFSWCPNITESTFYWRPNATAPLRVKCHHSLGATDPFVKTLRWVALSSTQISDLTRTLYSAVMTNDRLKMDFLTIQEVDQSIVEIHHSLPRQLPDMKKLSDMQAVLLMS